MREAPAEALLLLAYLLTAQGKHAKAVTILNGLAELLPGDDRVLRPLAHACLLDGRHAQALEVSEALLRPGGADLHGEALACALRLKAEALWGLGRRDEARNLLEESIRVNGADVEPGPDSRPVPAR